MLLSVIVMIDSQKGVLEFLEQLRKEREEIDRLIGGIEKRLGITGSQSPPPDNQAGQSAPKIKVSISDIPVGFFHNLSQAKAAEKLLKLNPGQPLSTPEMLDAFRRSGMELNPKNATTIFYTTLSRNPRFERVAGKAWGLSEWYPENRKRQETKKPVSDAEFVEVAP